jgi:LPLT family lysophospholipid transporter-like MFS transporter
VRANAWIEVSTVLAILFGVALGSLLVDDHAWLPRLLPSAAANATLWISVLYLLAGVCTAAIPCTAASNPTALAHPALLLRRFGAAFVLLWRDRAGQTSMAVTSLFWAISATLQFIILRWAAQVLHLALAQAALLQIAVAVGMIAGAIAAGRWVALRAALRILPIGIAIGAAVLLMTFVSSVAAAVGLLLVIGALSGLFLVPMNALLQQRGTALMHAGQSIAVQNFNENLASLLALAVYGALVYWNAPLLPTIAGFAVLVMVVMTVITARQMRHGAPDLIIRP